MMAPLGTALIALPFLAAGLASLGRIQKFFARETYFNKPDIAPLETLKEKRSLPNFEFELANAMIHNPNHDRPLFQNVSIALGEGKVGMVVGKVGCGKSSFLKAVIGELKLTSGSAKRSDEPIGYCDQTPWLEDGTILDNILGRDKYEEEWMNMVIQCCALDEDLLELESGIYSVVGPGGCRLSGGQKSRVVRNA